MVTVRKDSQKPLVEGEYEPKSLAPTFIGPHNKFTLLLPIRERIIGEERNERRVFSSSDIDELEQAFIDKFGGFTSSSKKHPLLEGNWLDALRKKTVANKHVLYEIYAQQNRETVDYFRDLKRGLHRRAAERGRSQDIIVIEQLGVTFVNEPVKLRT